ncbi:MAG: hypothetical protein ABIA67_04205 [Candidatus Margulisiibacteriota bacterium]
MANHEHFTTDQIEQALRASGGFLSAAAKKLNCSWATVCNYVRKYKHLQKVLDEINEAELDFSESKLLSQIKEGNTTAIIFHLKCKGKKRGYVERTENEHSGPGGGPIMIIGSPGGIDDTKI